MVDYYYEKNTAVIKLNRPEKRNALNPEMVQSIKHHLAFAANDDNIRSLIITGEGKSFCSGADLDYLNSLKKFSVSENENDSECLAELFLSLYKFPKPTIAAVNGAAIAGGCGLASACDIIVANPLNSKFGYSEVKIGFIPAIVSVFLIKKVGEGVAKRMLLTGDYIEGKRAYEIGLVDFLSENPAKYALEISETLNKNSLLSLTLTKKMVQTVSSMSTEDAVEYCTKLNAISRESEDLKKGLTYFLTKK